MSFEVNPLTDDLIAIKNQTAIARSLRNLVLTSPGERFFNNNLGSTAIIKLPSNANFTLTNFLKIKNIGMTVIVDSTTLVIL